MGVPSVAPVYPPEVHTRPAWSHGIPRWLLQQGALDPTFTFMVSGKETLKREGGGGRVARNNWYYAMLRP